MKKLKEKKISLLTFIIVLVGLIAVSGISLVAFKPYKTTTHRSRVESAERRERKEDQTALLEQATLTKEEANEIALREFPNATVSRTHIKEEDGTLLYSIKIKTEDGNRFEIRVNARDGSVISQNEIQSKTEK